MLIAVIIGGVLGYLIGDLLGMLIGAGLAYWLVRRLRRSLLGRLLETQRQFLDSTFAVMGCLCKADGQVTQAELDASRRLWERLRLNETQRERARASFTRGKSPEFDLDAELAVLRQVTRGQQALLQLFLQVQLSAIAADGVLHPAEHDMLLRVARGLGFSEADIQRIEAMLRGGSQAAGTTSGQSLEDAYCVLGIDASASDAEVKRAYRRLMSQNHPDKLASKGLPESMREVAKERTSEISTAYELIRKSRERQAA
ncbi:DnaJ like chaperone protein [Modicisalibacter ilicicola DSM 19980]|uniref:DnaJ like chaperone protein n=1 Tax=Modicisalibacter ilicicola DSM 19980 TaxID=1121942 RepID=A0A1M5AC44_9GAMM|nr:co-chaperone DjlA [Halomonas ilicicola]SHF27870.1 DnaJ like chaperone protein [Halomonas ilicicola DSM 19980]